jgi:hypothetical protein
LENKKKKPPDKIENVVISSLKIKEFSKKKEENKIREQMRKNNKIHLKRITRRNIGDVSDVVEEASLKKKVMKQEY